MKTFSTYTLKGYIRKVNYHNLTQDYYVAVKRTLLKKYNPSVYKYDNTFIIDSYYW